MGSRSGLTGALFEKAAITGLGVAAVSALAFAIAGPLYQLGSLGLRESLTLFRYAGYGGLIGAVICLAAAAGARRKALTKPLIVAVAGLLLSLPVGGLMGYWSYRAVTLPVIHDISTDTKNPPEFVAILPLRANSPNSAIYGGPDLAAKQHKAYPRVVPALLDVSTAKAFDLALMEARRMKWEIVGTDPAQGRIEATDTTRWFGFKDDVVIRVAPAGSGSRVDIRSVSRVGKSDVGTNACRIEWYLYRLAKSARGG